MSKDEWVKNHKQAQDDYVTGVIDRTEYNHIMFDLGMDAGDVLKELNELDRERAENV